MKQLKPIISIVLFSMTLTTSVTFADIGVKHKNQHKRQNNKIPDQIAIKPFDFSKIESEVRALHSGAVEMHLGAHVDQAELESLPAGDAFIEAFEEGDELFEINFNALDGVGINVGNGKRFTSIPRLDLDGEQSWSNVTPLRITGPNSDSCLSCPGCVKTHFRTNPISYTCL